MRSMTLTMARCLARPSFGTPEVGHLAEPARDAAVLPLAVLRDELRFHFPDRVVHPSLPRLAERRSGQGKNDRGEGKCAKHGAYPSGEGRAGVGDSGYSE